MPNYTYLTFAQMRTALAARLSDPNKLHWVDDELKRYIWEALRVWNALTNLWNADFTFSIVPPVGSTVWYDLTTKAGYPRLQTVTDTDLFDIMEYHLGEPATGGTWTGTGQFAISDLANALQRRRDETNQIAGDNLAALSQPSVPNTRRVLLPDDVLECRRARFVPATGSPTTLWRDDNQAFGYFTPGFMQNQPGPLQTPGTGPRAYSIITGPPLAFDVDITPQTAGFFDLLVSTSGPVFAPPAASLLGVPDDFSWVPKWGAMSDLFGMESEATDPTRAAYCLERYKDGLTLISSAHWLLLAEVGGQAVDTPSVAEMDAYSAEWDSNPNAPPCVVVGGDDFVAACPIPSAAITAISLTVVGNAPIPVFDADFVQVTRDTLDVMLDYAQHIATLKDGGREFAETMPLMKNFVLAAQAANSRLKELGIYRDILLGQGSREDEEQPRFERETA